MRFYAKYSPQHAELSSLNDWGANIWHLQEYGVSQVFFIGNAQNGKNTDLHAIACNLHKIVPIACFSIICMQSKPLHA